MKFFALFIYRPVATILLSVAITLCGILGFRMLPVAPLPQVDFPVIMVSASLPGASPETMASSVATPLERSLGRIAGVSEMTSSSSLGSTRIILQFDFDRDINGAARDVQAAINAAQSLLPSGMPSRPTYRKANPSDAPIMILTLTSDTYSQGELYDFASTQLAPTISQIDGVGDVDVGGSSLPAVRVGLNPQALFNQGVSLDDVRTAISNANVRKPQGALEDGTHRWQIQTNDELKTAAEYQPLIIHYNNGGAVINMFLAPATACLAVSIYTRIQILKENAIPILVGCTVGSLSSMGSVYVLCRLFGLDEAMTASLLPKSITTPIAVEVCQSHGGIVPVTVIAVIFTGILGSILAPYLIRIFRVKNPITAGLAIGACSHAVGTSKALELGETEGAMSGLAIGVCGIMTVIFSMVLL